MNLQELKQHIHSAIERIDDEELLKKIARLLEDKDKDELLDFLDEEES